jgi:hypothetical protein
VGLLKASQRQAWVTAEATSKRYHERGVQIRDREREGGVYARLNVVWARLGVSARASFGSHKEYNKNLSLQSHGSRSLYSR